MKIAIIGARGMPNNYGSFEQFSEYLAAGKKTVGTIGNGLVDLKNYLYLHEDYSLFSKELNTTTNNKEILTNEEFSWLEKTKLMISILKDKL